MTTHRPPGQRLWTKLLKHLNKTTADDEPLSLLTILESNGLDDAIWCLRTEPTPERIQRFALAVARRVEHLSPAAKECNDVTERYLNGTATKAEQPTQQSERLKSRFLRRYLHEKLPNSSTRQDRGQNQLDAAVPRKGR